MIAAAIAAFGLFVLLPSTSGPGAEMDEGAVMAYGARVMDGALPHRDFLTFHGPANPFVVAGAFEVVGTSVLTERVVGLVYRIVIVLALFSIAGRLAGLLGAVLAGVLAACALADELVWASPTYGALACLLLGVALLGRVATTPAGRLRMLEACGAGLAGGIALLMRFDFALAVAASAVPLFMLLPRRERVWYAGGLLLSAGLYVPHLILVGPTRTERLLDDLAATRAGRSLPLPVLTSDAGLLLTAGTAATGLLVVLGVYFLVRDNSLESRVMLAVGSLCVALVPWAIFRADIYHVRPFALIPLSLLPAVVLFLIDRTRCISLPVRSALRMLVAAFAVVFVLAFERPILDDAIALRGFRTAYHGFYREKGGGSVAAVVDEANARIQPGESLFVGPQDLRRTNYGPTYIYFLLSQARPASYYMEMNPKTANREGSGLPDELRKADWLILTSEWDSWSEPNASMELGPTEPNRVVEEAFCLRVHRGSYSLYERCSRPGGDASG